MKSERNVISLKRNFVICNIIHTIMPELKRKYSSKLFLLYKTSLLEVETVLKQ